MPLTPAEVHNVAFKKPPIGKRGYDEEEVDAFLDIVEVELQRLIEENNDLRGRLQSGQPAPEQPAGEGGADPAELAAVRDENGRLQSRIQELEQSLAQVGSEQPVEQAGGQDSGELAELQQRLAETEQQLNENRAQLEQAQAQLAESQAAAAQSGAAPAESGASPTADHHIQAVQMLALAQQTADQHMAQSKAEAERLVSEAQAQAQSTVEDANERSTRQISDAEARAQQLDEESSARAQQTISDAEQRAATITAQFEQRKAALERRVEELRTFEREYRTRLKSYLESQLRDLDASGKSEPASNASDYAEAQ
jgi:DivIVA domain-containing protein